MKGKIQRFLFAGIKLVLFLSSYIPLIFILMMQLIKASVNDQPNDVKISLKNMRSWLYLLRSDYFWYVLLLLLFSIILCLILYLVLRKTKSTKNLESSLRIKRVNNINSNYITNYFAVYIFPFITLNMTQFDGIGTVVLLTCIIGYVYIKNDILYINPILNILFKYNVYSAEIEENNVTTEVILLSRKSRAKIKISPDISVHKIGYNVFIEL
ncbi:hypothetical protein CBW65_18570 [Tumebacillus avium]|uniref:Uncharacterized protein n=1 Tax=Tumebacillus avium TaxID=1903704 RepID=A0A1Y0IQP2_9BACL|nr:hypothetical protein CBW65_18570 [Tumebacillus avium]